MPRTPFTFRCTGCGRCCEGRGLHVIETTSAERERIRRRLGVSERWFRRRYLTVFADGLVSLRWEAPPVGGPRRGQGRCVFLDHSMRCRIYALRPAQCRIYPYWPEMLESPRVLRDEAKRCEGIRIKV